MQTGEIYLFDNTAGYKHSIRVHSKIICFDNYEVFDNGKKIEDNSWYLDEKKVKTAIFSRFSLSNFECWATKIGYESYSDERLTTLRPDLIMRIGRVRELSWGDDVFKNEESIKIYINKYAKPSVRDKKLKAHHVYLEGYNKNEMPQKPVLITANNGCFFTLPELLYQANIIQMNIKMNKGFKSEGIGIYRSGIKNGIPSYYIWSFYDLANNLRDYETKGVDITEA